MKWKDNLWTGRKYLQMMQPTRAYFPKYTNSSYNSIIKKQQPNQKIAEDLNRYFSKEVIEMVKRHMERCSWSQIGKYKSKQQDTTSHQSEWPWLKGLQNNKCWRGCEEKWTLLHSWWECKLVQSLWKTVWKFIKKLKIELPYYLANHFWAYTQTKL